MHVRRERARKRKKESERDLTYLTHRSKHQVAERVGIQLIDTRQLTNRLNYKEASTTPSESSSSIVISNRSSTNPRNPRVGRFKNESPHWFPVGVGWWRVDDVVISWGVVFGDRSRDHVITRWQQALICRASTRFRKDGCFEEGYWISINQECSESIHSMHT